MSVNTKVNGQLVKSAGLYKVSVPIQSGDIYSFEERQVGVWTDGKPLYQKTFIFEGTYTGVNNDLSISIPNADNAFIASCWVKNLNNAIFNLSYAYADNNANNVTAFISADKSALGLRVGSNQTVKKLVVTIQYTKTTDVAGSGEYVPSGDKAVHYSTDEQVIGTWVDGSTLYRKTFDCGALPNNTSKNIADITSLNINYAISFNGFAYAPNSSSLAIRPIPNASGELTAPNNSIRCDINDNYLRIVTYANWSTYNGYVTLEYTKSS